MPLARLITNAGGDADELAADLRSRGFTVEVVSPDAIPSYSVDLEIRVEECASEQALRNVEELSKAEDIHVFIGPGAIVESLRPMITIPLVPEAEEVVAEPAPIVSVVPDEVVTPQHLSSLAAEEDVVDEVEAIELPPLVEASTSPIHAEEVYAELKDVVSQQIAASESPVEESVHALEAEEVYPPSDWPIWQPLAEEPKEELVPVAAAEVCAEPLRKSTSGLAGKWQNDRLFWRVAVVTSVVAVATLLLGVSTHRFSPLPRGLQSASEDAVPFQKAKGDVAAPQAVAEVPAAVPTTVAAPEFKRVVAHVPVVERPSLAEHLAKHVDIAKRVQRAATRHEDDYVAEDTVVRFGKKKPVSPVVQAQKRSAIKHYSDLR